MSTMSGTLSSTRSRLTRMISAPSAMPEASAVSASTTPSSSEIMWVLREIRLRSAASRSDSIPPDQEGGGRSRPGDDLDAPALHGLDVPLSHEQRQRLAHRVTGQPNSSARAFSEGSSSRKR